MQAAALPPPCAEVWASRGGVGQGQPERGGERTQNLLRDKDRAPLGRKIRCGSGKSGETCQNRWPGKWKALNSAKEL